MAGQVVVFGATGYTGELTARCLVERGVRPVLAGRSADRLAGLAAELGDLETRVADVARPESVRDLVAAGDVLLTTVGPFSRWGDAAVQAAISVGAHYVDSTGEPAFIRRIFEDFGSGAADTGIGLLTAFGFDWVPGNLAGALALRGAGSAANRLDIGYFTRGHGGLSGGTRASLAGILVEDSFAFRDGALRSERVGAHVLTFDLGGGRVRRGVSVGGSEHFALPALDPSLRQVTVVLGQRGWWVPAAPVFTAALAAAARFPPTAGLTRRVLGRGAAGSTGGPDAAARARSGCLILADARAADGRLLARVQLDGPNPYDFTAGLLAWAASAALAGGLRGVGALGPVAAFGLDAVVAGAAQAGLLLAPTG